MAKMSEAKPTDFDARLAIDRSDLDSCLEDQPILVNNVGQLCAQANFRRDEAKLLIVEKHAELDDKVRAQYEGEKKPTEASITNEIRGHKEMELAQRDFLDAKLEAEQWDRLFTAILQRGYSLNKMVDMELRRMGIEEGMTRLEKASTDLSHRRVERAREEAPTRRRPK